jgi:hypothetical protein
MITIIFIIILIHRHTHIAQVVRHCLPPLCAYDMDRLFSRNGISTAASSSSAAQPGLCDDIMMPSTIRSSCGEWLCPQRSWSKYRSEDGHMWWCNVKSNEWFFEETGSTKNPVEVFGGCSGKFGGCRQSGCADSDSDGEESTATGSGSTSVSDSASVSTNAVPPLAPTAGTSGPRLPPIDEDHCTHRAFYYNMYSPASGTHEPPDGDFKMGQQVFEC